MYRRLSRAFVAVVIATSMLWVRASLVRAGDPPEAPKPPQAPEDPRVEHGADDMVLEERGLPDGWKLVSSTDGAADESALKEAITALAKSKGVTPEAVVLRSVTGADGKKAVLALIDLEKKAPEFLKALDEAATGKGWATRTMAADTRLLVVSAPEDVRPKAVALQVMYAGRALGAKAFIAIQSESETRAAAFAQAIHALDEMSAIGNFLLGRATLLQVAHDKAESEGRSPPTDQLKKASVAGMSMVRLALAKDATNPIAAKEVPMLLGALGGAILNADKGPSEEATKLLEDAVQRSKDAGIARPAEMEFRYNLACAYGRSKDIEKAFPILMAVLEAQAKDPVDGLDIWREDPDLGSLHADPRWAELTKKYPASGN